MRTELSAVSGHTARTVRVEVSGATAGEGPATWGQQAIRAAMLDMEPDDYGTNIRVLHPLAPPVPLDTALAAVGGLLTVYDSLRTRVTVAADGGMRQHLDAAGTHDVHVFAADDAVAAAGLVRLIEARWHRVRFACADEWPVRTALVTVGGEVAHMVVVLSHIASDALGLSLVHRTLARLLDGADPVALREESAGYQPLEEAAYQASEKGRRRDRAAREQWRKALRDCPERMFTRRAGAEPAFRQAVLASPSLPKALDTLSERWQIPSSAILLAAAATVTARQAGTDRCALQVMVSNRFLPRLRETVSPITVEGLFVLGVGEEDFETRARQAARTAMKTYYHAYFDRAALADDLREVVAERGAGMDLTCWYNDLRDMTPHTRNVDDREHGPGRPEHSLIEWETVGDQSETSVAWHLYSSSDHLMPVTLTVDTSLVDEPAAEAMLTGFETLITEAAGNPRMSTSHRLSTVIMCHPSRRAGAERIARECRPLETRIVEDPDPGGVPSPLRTAKAAWAAVEPGATHHIVLQDDVRLRPDFAAHLHRLLDRHPGCAVSLGVLWVSPYNSYRVRQAAVGGYPAVELAPWEWVPSLGLALPADTARELAAFLATFPDSTRDDDEHIAVFCAERKIPVVAPVPHLLDHSAGPSVAGNDHHGVRLGVACTDAPVAADYWDGPVLQDAGVHEDLGYAVDLVDSRCAVRIRRSGVREVAEQPFTWPWRPWSQLLGVAPESIAEAAAAEGPAPLPEPVAAEVWAAGFLLGARTRQSGRSEYRAVRDATEAEAVRSWITAGLRGSPADPAAAFAWARRAVAAGLRHAALDDRSVEATVERMARREAEHLLQTAPDELPDIRLEIRPCPECGTPSGDVTRFLPYRWLAEHLHSSGSADAPALAALSCELLEPRPLAALANLAAGGGWHGTAETRAATAARLRSAGTPWPALLAEVDAGEERFTSGADGTVTLPASGAGSAGWLTPHPGPEARRWEARYWELLMRHWRDVGL